MAAGLAGSGADILVLEAGDHLPDRPENRDPRAIFQRGFFRPKESWYDETGSAFNPGNYYNVGGNSKFYGAVLTRYRAEDFDEMQHLEGVSPAWPFPYEELEPWYGKAEDAVSGARHSWARIRPSRPIRRPMPFRRFPTKPPIAALRERLKRLGVHPSSLPLGVDIDTLARARRRRHGMRIRNSFNGKMDAETAALAAGAQTPECPAADQFAGYAAGNCRPTARPSQRCVYDEGRRKALSSSRKLVILSAGAVQSAVLLLRSANDRQSQRASPTAPTRSGAIS